jgi:hypothetical protein
MSENKIIEGMEVIIYNSEQEFNEDNKSLVTEE